MTLEELQAEADALAARRNDPRTPGIVRRALLSPGGLTLRAYLQLEEMGSPLLTGEWPAGDAEAMAREFAGAWQVVCPGRAVPLPAELPGAMAELQEAVARATSTIMPMRWPETGKKNHQDLEPEGLGWAVRLLGQMVSHGHAPEDVLEWPLDALWVLQAGMLAYEGFRPAGVPYAERETGGLDQ